MSEDNFRIRPGKGRNRGSGSGRRAQSLVGQVINYSMKGGHGLARSRHSGTGRTARGRRAGLAARSRLTNRRVIIKARVVRHKGARFRAAPLARHLAYLKRDGVTRDGRDAGLFDARSDNADGEAFAGRSEDDRHHFRFIVSPEDAGELEDIRVFTRELMDDMARDLDTRLDWVAVDHWNTDNPHVHILVRGRTGGEQDLVIDKEYIKTGLRARAEERVTIELGPRSEREIERAFAREVEAERWTSLDRSLQRMADQGGGVVDLRPDPLGNERSDRANLLGRSAKLERLGLATRIAPACWTLKPGLEDTLRDLSIRGDIIKTMHRAMSAQGLAPDTGRFALNEEPISDPVIGRLVERGLHDELTGRAYAVVDATDGRTHFLRFDDMEMTGDAKPGAIVELSRWTDNRGHSRQSLMVRSDLSLGEQVGASGATWLDRQLVAREPAATAGGFGQEVRDALAARSEHLASEGLARRQGQRFLFARDLLDELRTRELADAAKQIATRSGLDHAPRLPGEHIAGIYRERVTLASGRYAMIDNGMGFELVPWKPSLERHLGDAVAGTINARGGVDWSFTRSRTLGL